MNHKVHDCRTGGKVLCAYIIAAFSIGGTPKPITIIMANKNCKPVAGRESRPW